MVKINHWSQLGNHSLYIHSIFISCKKYTLKSGSGNLKFAFWRVLFEGQFMMQTWKLHYSLIQKNRYTFASVYSSKCVTVFLNQTLILEEWTQHPQYGFSQWKQILFEVAFSIYMIFEEFWCRNLGLYSKLSEASPFLSENSSLVNSPEFSSTSESSMSC